LKIINIEEIDKITGVNVHLFNSIPWLKVVTNTYGIGFYAVFDEYSKNILPFCLLEDEYFSSVKSIPFGDYTLINYPNDFLTGALHLLQKTYPDRYIETTVVNDTLPEIENYKSSKSGFLIQIDIDKWRKSSDWKEAYERNIRNALNHGLTVKISTGLDSLAGFYKFHEQLRINKFNKLPQPYSFFTNIYNEFFTKGKGFFLEAWHQGHLIASWVILEHEKTLYYKFGASEAASLYLRPNDLLFRSLVQTGSKYQFKTIDLGFSGASKSYEGLIRFKSKEGGKKDPIFHLEYFSETLDKQLSKKRANYLYSTTKKAIDSGNIQLIRKVSNENYGKFA